MKAVTEAIKTFLMMTAFTAVCLAAAKSGCLVRTSVMHCIAITVTMRIYTELLAEYIKSRK